MNIVVVRSGGSINEAISAINSLCGAIIQSPRPDYDGLLDVIDIVSISGPLIIGGSVVVVAVCEVKKTGVWEFSISNAAIAQGEEAGLPSWAMSELVESD